MAMKTFTCWIDCISGCRYTQKITAPDIDSGKPTQCGVCGSRLIQVWLQLPSVWTKLLSPDEELREIARELRTKQHDREL